MVGEFNQFDEDEGRVIPLTPDLVASGSKFATATATLYKQDGEAAFRQLLHVYYQNMLEHMPRIVFQHMTTLFNDSTDSSASGDGMTAAEQQRGTICLAPVFIATASVESKIVDSHSALGTRLTGHRVFWC